MKVVLYARISSDRSGEMAGVGRQLDDMRALAARHRDRIETEVIDNDESAYRRTKPRPGFTRVVEMIKASEVRGVYAWHPDRLYRSPRDLEELVDLVEAHNVMIRTCQAGDLDLNTPSGRMVARMLGAAARHESEHGAERRARKHTEIAKQGNPAGGGRRPFGFETDQKTIVLAEADALRAAAEHILAGGTLAEAARHMSATLNRHVRPNILRSTLTGPRIAGWRQHIPMADRRRGVSSPTLTRATWDAIVDDETWRKLRTILLDPRRQKIRPPRAYLLSCVVRCGLCKQPLTGGNERYRCSTTTPGGCGRLGVSRVPVDAIVTAWVKTLIDSRDLARRLTRLSSTEPPTTPADTEAVAQRMAILAEMFADGQLTPDEWKVARDRLDTNMAQARQADADRTRRTESARRLANVLVDWDTATIAEQRGAVAALLDQTGQRIVIEPRSKRNGSKFDPTRVQFVKAEGP